jgi:hypothetical protein
MKHIGYISTRNHKLLDETGKAVIYHKEATGDGATRPVFLGDEDVEPVCFIDHRDTLAQVARYGSAMTVLRRENIAHLGVGLYTHPSPDDVRKLEQEISRLRLVLTQWTEKEPVAWILPDIGSGMSTGGTLTRSREIAEKHGGVPLIIGA